MHRRVWNGTQWTNWVLIATTNSTVASADNLASINLTSQTVDLNDLRTGDFKIYHNGSNSNITNYPPQLNNSRFFNLQVFRVSNSGDYCQIYTSINTVKTYRRFYNTGSGWNKWVQIIDENDLTTLTNRITALEAKVN